MRKRVIPLLSLLAVLALASCSSPGTTSTTPGKTSVSTPTTALPTTAPTTKPLTNTATAPPKSQPAYGGTITTISASDPMGFDEAYTATMMATTLRLTNEELMMGDWAKGPGGTNEIDWQTGYLGRIDVEAGCLAEKWEMPDSSTIVFRLRHGVHYALNTNSEASRLVAGREVTADDAVFSINRQWTSPASFIVTSNVPENRLISVKALDKYTVECKVPPNFQGPVLFITGDQLKIIPPEVVTKYGDLKNWKNSVGTGPFMLTDFVPSASLTFSKNPNYWQTDPLNPKNQLPYADGFKQLIIADTSTQLAAFRTGKVDMLPPLNYDDFQSLMAGNPQTQYAEASGTHPAMWGRMDKVDLPFKDLKVRQALNMAVNKQAIVDGYYRGRADLCSPIFPNNKSYAPFTTQYAQMPQDVKDLFTYDPQKAKQLLADAGYPNGFRTKIACTQNDADFIALIVADWAKVGVTLQIQQMEAGVFNSVMRGRTFEEMIFKETTSRGFPYKMNEVLKENLDDVAFFEDPKTREVYNQIQPFVGKDDTKWAKLLHDIYPYIISQAEAVWLPSPTLYRVWQPWVKGYHGELNMGYDNTFQFYTYIWVDSSLKK
jgi:peptide/nickel transport system substrate-binding protein